MLLYLLVGALLLSTVLNFYFLLRLDARLDARLVDQALESQLLDSAITPQQPVPLQLPDKSPDNQPVPVDTLLLVQP